MTTSVGPRSSATSTPAKRATLKWSRLVHVYTSMVALLLVLFFGVTGITLNHPTWSIGDAVSTSSRSGTLPVSPTLDGGAVNYLGASEFARTELGVSGEVEGFDSAAGSATIRYRKPGYAADLTFSLTDARYELATTQQGWLFGILNDLHKGRHADTSWKWVIDVAGLLLVVMAIAGIVLQLMLTRRRRSAFVVAAVGAVLTLVLAWIAVS